MIRHKYFKKDFRLTKKMIKEVPNIVIHETIGISHKPDILISKLISDYQKKELKKYRKRFFVKEYDPINDELIIQYK